MATPAELRKQIAALTKLAEKDVRLLLARLDDFAERGVALNDVLPALIDTYGQAAATVAADWYDELREQNAVRGNFAAIPSAPARNAGVPELVSWARSKASSPESMLELALGGMQRRIADQSRLTVIGSSLYDPRSEGWMRIGDGDNCGFCDMLISRGAVYTEATVSFGAHDWCNCQAGPSFGRPSDVFDVKAYRRSSRRWNEDGSRTDASLEDDARARAWIEENLGGDAVPKAPGRKTPGTRPDQLSAFEAMSVAQIERQLEILNGLPDSDYKSKYGAKLRARLAELQARGT